MEEKITLYGSVTMDAEDYVAMVDMLRNLQHQKDMWFKDYMKVSAELRKLKEELDAMKAQVE